MYGTSPMAAGRTRGVARPASGGAASDRGTVEHVLGVRDGLVADFDAPEHACDLLHALGGREHLHLHARGAVARLLYYAHVVLAERRDLRQVRDAQHLAAGGERAQLLTYDLGHAPADAH